MTKHLRLLMLALLAIICTGGVKAAVGDIYKLVTSVDQLKAGDVIVIANAENEVALGSQNGKYRDKVGIPVSNGSITYANGITEITLEGADGAWKLKTNSGYLCEGTNTGHVLP